MSAFKAVPVTVAQLMYESEAVSPSVKAHWNEAVVPIAGIVSTEFARVADTATALFVDAIIFYVVSVVVVVRFDGMSFAVENSIVYPSTTRFPSCIGFIAL